MKTQHIIYPLILILMVGVPVLRYYVSTPGINACVLDYTEALGSRGSQGGYIYSINGSQHIEYKESNMNMSLSPYKVGVSRGCIMASDNLFSDLNNTFYCTISYLIQQAPIGEKYKQPFGILKSGAGEGSLP